jgi:hypothetical protein
VFEFTFNVTYFDRVIDILCMCSYLVYQTLNILFSVVTPKVEGAKSNTPSKTNTYKRLPITNTLLP